MEATNTAPAAGQAFKIDVSKGQRVGTVSAQWASRPEDQRFLSLSALEAQCAKWADESKPHNIETDSLVVKADGAHKLIIEHEGEAFGDPTNFAVGQLASLAGAPSQYIASLPAPLAALNINYGLKAAPNMQRQLYVREPAGTVERLLRAVTSTKYGRIYDRDVVKAVRNLAGDGTGDTRWKVPGMIDWGAMKHNPNVDITKDTTTLYASDRDVFMFLCDDRNPIEIGKLPDGSPDFVFRGFYVWNSEVGARTFGLATMYLRGVCQNRNLWGVEGFSEVTFAHYKGAPERFITEAIPALTTYAEAGTGKLIEGVAAAKGAKVASDDEARITFLMRFGFSESQAKNLIGEAEKEEGHKPETVWDMAQAVTAAARSMQFQDQRLTLEAKAGKMLDKVASA